MAHDNKNISEYVSENSSSESEFDDDDRLEAITSECMRKLLNGELRFSPPNRDGQAFGLFSVAENPTPYFCPLNPCRVTYGMTYDDLRKHARVVSLSDNYTSEARAEHLALGDYLLNYCVNVELIITSYKDKGHGPDGKDGFAGGGSGSASSGLGF